MNDPDLLPLLLRIAEALDPSSSTTAASNR
jgi:hypothetical protein